MTDSPKTYRRKDTGIDGMLYAADRSNELAVLNWLYDAPTYDEVFTVSYPDEGDGFYLRTDERVMRVCPGDWVIRDAADGFMPCSAAVFAAKYEPIGESRP